MTRKPSPDAQPALFGQGHGRTWRSLPTTTPAHNGTPTSKAAARSVKRIAGTVRERVLQYLVDRGSEGATDEEIQRALGLPSHSETPRRNELVKRRLVRARGDRRPTTAGRQAVVWVAIKTGSVSP